MPPARSPRRRGHRRLPAAGLLVAAIVLAGLSGCDDQPGEPPPPTTTSTPSAPPAGATTTLPCPAGGRTLTLEGMRVREFCGPARAEVTIGPETLQFAGGECARHPTWFSVNIGVEVVDPQGADAISDPAFRSFTVLMGQHPLGAEAAAAVATDGVYTDAVITFAVPESTYLVDDETVRLLATRTAGTFSGVGFLDAARDQPLETEGMFTCDETVIPLERIPELMEAEEEEEAGEGAGGGGDG